ncbi:putative GTPase activating protein for Arf-domain-containing protein [Infundibulicybe gibba]|nr:putative GTPase activating protein for Arf-domain-containing protein [Infundibulicybe gibba]
MSGQNKITAERNQRTLLDLVVQPGNDVCADCKARSPRWASHNLGVFICVNCASIHRKLGTHISKVKSLTLDSWTKDQVESMKEKGNIKSNTFYNPNEARHPPPANFEDSERDSELEQYIRSKYQYKKFLDRSAIVASKLGPSRSLSSVTPTRPRSTPVADPPSKPAAATTAVKPSTPSAEPAKSHALDAQRPPVSAPMAPTRSVSQPISSLYPQQPPKAPGGVWDDLISLQTPSASSSLPLQFQPPSMMSTQASSPLGTLPQGQPQMFTGNMNSMGMGGMSSMNGMSGMSSMNGMNGMSGMSNGISGMSNGMGGMSNGMGGISNGMGGASNGVGMGMASMSTGYNSNPFHGQQYQQQQLGPTNPFAQHLQQQQFTPTFASPTPYGPGSNPGSMHSFTPSPQPFASQQPQQQYNFQTQTQPTQAPFFQPQSQSFASPGVGIMQQPPFLSNTPQPMQQMMMQQQQQQQATNAGYSGMQWGGM